ncbi:meprin A subunit beta isoform X2 [Osmerus mordax]|uniref:meprin A subunit beta isoform X2 n=1 Tax=Osmerus mordax TaxID=8014 RepID=UPI00350F6CF7
MAHRWFLLVLVLLCRQNSLTSSKLTGETEIDEDEGKDRDIFDINEGLDLVEGDIVMDEVDSRNTIIGEKYRWPTTIPYYLEDSLDINAKGVILKAFEQYGLKTCIHFTPWKGEENYISVFKGSGCFSSVGNRRVGKQRLSIGHNCDRLATVEHEFLHALGLWHEQSRADRDDYVDIMWDRIEAGKEHNFNTYDDTESSALNVPYDYGSVMHYSKTAFNVGKEPTIVTKIPHFMDVIGQRMEFSESDLLKLNRLYNCTTSSTFLDSCSFEKESICGMIQGPEGNRPWERKNHVNGGPQTDYTEMGDCKGKGFFMHFSTVAGNPGNHAHLESRLLYPSRWSQCLQFYLHNSGGADDALKVWVREYDQANPRGKLRLVQRVPVSVRDVWELHHVTLDVKNKFRVVFEGVKGTGPSTGGLSLDDINLSETTCPQNIWRIRNITGLLATTPVGKKLYSPRFLSPAGYSYQVGVYLNGRSGPGSLAVYLHLTSGPDDDILKWPCPWQQVTIALMDQNADIRQRMSNQRMITTDPNKLSSDGMEYFWDDPRKVGSGVSEPDGSYMYRGPGTGTSSYLTHGRMRSRDFIKGDDTIFLISMEDVSRLVETQPLPPSAVACGNGCQEKRAAQVSPQESTGSITAVMAVSLSVAASMLVVATASVVHARRSRGRQEDREVVLENIEEHK